MAFERWKDIPGWEGLYQVSDHGRVVGARGIILKSRVDHNGYCNRLDNRPQNLEYVTRVGNAQHREKFGKALAGNGHPRAKLNFAQVQEIRHRRANGEKQSDLAAEYGVNKNTIWWATTGGGWKKEGKARV